LVVQVPRFEFKVPTFKLNKVWTGLGLKQTVDDPNLTQMLVLPEKSALKMDIYHQTYIKVNEVGTEAAAATAAVISYRGMVEEDRLVFDRAFLFLIRHSESGAILLLGRVEHPEPMEHRPHHPSRLQH
jgi:serpin B